MKHSIIFLLAILLAHASASAQMNVGSSSAPDSSAMLQVSGNTKGFLPPRMTRDSMYLIVNPAKGLLVFNTTDSTLFMHRDTGWVALTPSGSGWSTTGNSIINSAVNSIGTINNHPLSFKTNNLWRMHIDSVGGLFIGDSINSFNVNISSTQAGLRSDWTTSLTSADTPRIALQGQIRANLTPSSGSAQIRGFNGSALVGISNGVSSNADIYGGYFLARRQSVSGVTDGGGTLNILAGAGIAYGHTSTASAGGTTNNVYGVRLDPSYAAGTITNLYGLYMAAPQATGGTVTNMYDMYLANQSLTGVTNSWGIYQANSKNNYFAGNVGIGTSSPSTALHVVGTNPLTLNGVQTGTSTSSDSLLTITNGLVRKLSIATFGSGSVTSVSINSTNGLSGTVANAATTPSITLSTTVTGLIKGNGTALSAATSGTDYAPGTAGNATGIVKSTTSTGTLTTAVAADFPTLNQNTTGNAATVTTNANLTGDVTSVGNASTIATGVVTNSKLATMAATTFKANNTGSTASPSDITATQATAMLNVFTSTIKGLVPVSGGGTANFLRADGTFATPPGTGLSSLNGLTATTQTFATGTTGTAPAWNSSVSTHTLTIPLASASGVTAGLLSNADWSTFNNKATTVGTWSNTGNSGTSSGTNFLGTSDNTSFKIRTNNIQRLLIDSLGNVAIGSNPSFTTSPNAEKLLVDAGSTAGNPTTSFNLITAKGYIDNYLQFNIQNKAATASASSDFVATADNGNETSNYIDLGINGSGNTANYFGSPNDAYLYNLGQNLLIGTGTANKSLVFMTGGATQSTNERMRIDGSGNVGIGTSSPSTVLHVVGTNPLTLNGVQTGTSTSSDSLLTITNGLVRKLSIATFATPSNVLSSLNGLTTAMQTFATGTSGTDFNIASSGSTHTFNLPDASSTARGAITTGTQTLAGSKTFLSAPTFSTFTAGSVPYMGTGGLLSQINSSFFWDATNKRLGIGTTTPTSDLTLYQSSGSGSTKGFTFTGNSIGGTSSGTGFLMSLGYNQAGNKQLWLGDADYANNVAGTFLRFEGGGTSLPTLDAISGDNTTRRYIALGVAGDANSGVTFGNDNSTTNPGSYVWDNGNMAIGSSYRSNAAPTNGLLIQGNVGIGTTSPTAGLHLKAGTASAGTAPLKLTSGTNLTTPEAGAVEFDGTNYYATSGSTRYTLAKTLTGTAVLDFTSTAANSSSTISVTLTGATDGDVVLLGIPNASNVANSAYSAYVSSANTVTIKLINNSGSAIDPASGTFRVSVLKY